MEENAKLRKGGFRSLTMFIVLAGIFGFGAVSLFTLIDDFSAMFYVFCLLSVLAILFALLMIVGCADFNKTAKQLHSEYNAAIEKVAQVEKQLAEAKKSPTFEEFCEDKYV